LRLNAISQIACCFFSVAVFAKRLKIAGGNWISAFVDWMDVINFDGHRQSTFELTLAAKRLAGENSFADGHPGPATDAPRWRVSV
jgi:hypothetical protein